MKSSKVLYNEREYVKNWFKRNKMSFKDATSPGVFGSLYLDYHEELRIYKHTYQSKLPGLKKDALQYAFNEFLEAKALEHRIETIRKFDTEGEDLTPLKQFVQAVTGGQDERIIAVMAHWCWLIKRKGVGAPVKHHIMPIFYGAQGAGKSIAILKLMHPLKEVILSMAMSQLSDERIYESMSQNLIIFFDELQGVARTDMTVLKHKITADFNTYRKLHSHSVVNVPMSCTFIGATNKHLNESINDSTGQRRFYEIPTLARVDWAAINSIDYVALWKGVDERLDDGYLTGDILQKVHAAQQALVNEEELDIYVNERNIMVVGLAQKEVSADQLYSDYRSWAVEAGVHRPFTKAWFVRKLDNKGVLNFVKFDARNVRVKYFIVDASCPVGIDTVAAPVLPFKKGDK